MSIPSDRKYASSHEWVKAEDGVMKVGITDPAQDQLGDLVYVGDVRVGVKLKSGETAGVVESVKAASDIHAPVSGEVLAFNSALSDSPEQINANPYGTWILNSSQTTSRTWNRCSMQAAIKRSWTQAKPRKRPDLGLSLACSARVGHKGKKADRFLGVGLLSPSLSKPRGQAPGKRHHLQGGCQFLWR